MLPGGQLFGTACPAKVTLPRKYVGTERGATTTLTARAVTVQHPPWQLVDLVRDLPAQTAAAHWRSGCIGGCRPGLFCCGAGAWRVGIELFQVVRDLAHWRFRCRKNMRLRSLTGIFFQCTGRTDDVIARRIGNGRSAFAAERTFEGTAGAVVDDHVFALQPAKVCVCRSQRRAEQGAVMFAAPAAMTMRHPSVGATDFIANGTTETGTLSHGARAWLSVVS